MSFIKASEEDSELSLSAKSQKPMRSEFLSFKDAMSSATLMDTFSNSFFDGFFARLFKVTGELGLQLDSLADMVTSGRLPTLTTTMVEIHSCGLTVLSTSYTKTGCFSSTPTTMTSFLSTH